MQLGGKSSVNDLIELSRVMTGCGGCFSKYFDPCCLRSEVERLVSDLGGAKTSL